MSRQALRRLSGVIEEIGPLAVAVSGGVDSMTLAMVAHGVLGRTAHMMHAVSPAVPVDATGRVRSYARRHRWALSVIDAGEFQDASYLANPVNRCFFCKTHLYASMSTAAAAPLVSGTNTDDLHDYRPGLQAAAAHRVRHPYVEADIDKAGVRSIARRLDLDDLAELPASPCLSSRIETGLPIEARSLTAVYEVEEMLRRALRPQVVRCRIRREAAVVELDQPTLAGLQGPDGDPLRARVGERLREAGVERAVRFEVYRRGSAFIGASGPG